MKKWKKAIPQYNLGYGKYKESVKTLIHDHKNLHFTGNYLAGISVSDTIKHASELADAIMSSS